MTEYTTPDGFTYQIHPLPLEKAEEVLIFFSQNFSAGSDLRDLLKRPTAAADIRYLRETFFAHVTYEGETLNDIANDHFAGHLGRSFSVLLAAIRANIGDDDRPPEFVAPISPPSLLLN